MSYGFSAISDSGFTLIDQDYENYGYYTSGSVLASQTTVSAPILVDFAQDIILVRSNSYDIAIYAYALFPVSGGTEVYLRALSSTAITVEYLIIRRFSTISYSSDTYGLDVYKSDGALAYSSSVKVPSIKIALNLTPAADGSYTEYTIAVSDSVMASKKRYFSLMPARNVGFTYNGTTGFIVSRVAEFINDNSFHTYCTITGISGLPANVNFGSYQTFLIVDF